MAKKTEQANQILLELPYAELQGTASRQKIRDQFGTGAIKGGKQKYNIKHSLIKIRQGFNARLNINNLPMAEYLEKVLMIPELGAMLYANGYPPPALLGDFNADATEFILTEGHRRYYAIAWILAQGHKTWPKTGTPIEMVEVETHPLEYTELDRAKLTIHSQDNLKLTPLEYGHKFLQFNRVFGMSHEEIAAEFHGNKSRQWVTNMIALAELPLDVQKAIADGKLTPTAALALKINSPETISKKVQESIKEGTSIKVKDALAASDAPADYSDYRARMNIIVGDCRLDPFLCPTSITKCNDIREKAVKQFPTELKEIDKFLLNIVQMIHNIQNGIEETDASSYFGIEDEEENAAPFVVETDAANELEEESHKTSAKTPVVHPKSQKDVLPDIDFSHEKEEGIMDLTEAIGMTDKISARLKNTPMPEQHKKDLQGLCEAIVNRCQKAKEILKKAADKR